MTPAQKKQLKQELVRACASAVRGVAGDFKFTKHRLDVRHNFPDTSFTIVVRDEQGGPSVFTILLKETR